MTLKHFSDDVGHFRIRGGAKGVHGHAVSDQGFALGNPVLQVRGASRKAFCAAHVKNVLTKRGESETRGFAIWRWFTRRFPTGKMGKLTRDVPLEATMGFFCCTP